MYPNYTMFAKHFLFDDHPPCCANVCSPRSMDGISFQLSHKELDELNIICQRLSYSSVLSISFSLSLMRRHLFRIKTYQGQHNDDDENDGFWSNGIYAGNPRSFIRPFCKKVQLLVSSWGRGRQKGGGRPDQGGAAGTRAPQVCCILYLWEKLNKS